MKVNFVDSCYAAHNVSDITKPYIGSISHVNVFDYQFCIIILITTASAGFCSSTLLQIFFFQKSYRLSLGFSHDGGKKTTKLI